MGRHARIDPATIDTASALLPGQVEWWHTNCRKCNGRLADEPGYKHCLMCGRLWPVTGARIADQLAWERSGGLAKHTLGEESRYFGHEDENGKVVEKRGRPHT